MRLTGRCRDVLEVRVIVQDHCAMVFRHGGTQQVDHASRPVMTTGRHPDLDITGAVSDHLADGQYNIKFPAAPGDFPHVGQVAAGVARFQVDSHARRGSPVSDETGDDAADDGMLVFPR